MTLTLDTLRPHLKKMLPVEAQQLYVDGYNKAIADGYEDEWVEAAAMQAVIDRYEPPRGPWVKRQR